MAVVYLFLVVVSFHPVLATQGPPGQEAVTTGPTAGPSQDRPFTVDYIPMDCQIEVKPGAVGKMVMESVGVASKEICLAICWQVKTQGHKCDFINYMKNDKRCKLFTTLSSAKILQKGIGDNVVPIKCEKRPEEATPKRHISLQYSAMECIGERHPDSIYEPSSVKQGLQLLLEEVVMITDFVKDEVTCASICYQLLMQGISCYSVNFVKSKDGSRCELLRIDEMSEGTKLQSQKGSTFYRVQRCCKINDDVPGTTSNDNKGQKKGTSNDGSCKSTVSHAGPTPFTGVAMHLVPFYVQQEKPSEEPSQTATSSPEHGTASSHPLGPPRKPPKSPQKPPTSPTSATSSTSATQNPTSPLVEPPSPLTPASPPRKPSSPPEKPRPWPMPPSENPTSPLTPASPPHKPTSPPEKPTSPQAPASPPQAAVSPPPAPASPPPAPTSPPPAPASPPPAPTSPPQKPTALVEKPTSPPQKPNPTPPGEKPISGQATPTVSPSGTATSASPNQPVSPSGKPPKVPPKAPTTTSETPTSPVPSSSDQSSSSSPAIQETANPPSQTIEDQKIPFGSCGHSIIRPGSTHQRRKRLAGGRENIPHTAPWIVEIRTKGIKAHICAGVLVKTDKDDSSNIVVTSRTCFTSSLGIERMEVVAGVHNRKKSEGTVTMNIHDYVMLGKNSHGGRGTGGKGRGLAVLILSQAINFTDTIQPICLPQKNDKLDDGTRGVVSGWGSTTGSASTIVDSLKYISVTTARFKKCTDRVHYLDPNEVLCVGNGAGGQGTCVGDSGDPYYAIGEKGYTLYGVVDVDYGCTRSNYFETYSKVAPLADLILKEAAVRMPRVH